MPDDPNEGWGMALAITFAAAILLLAIHFTGETIF